MDRLNILQLFNPYEFYGGEEGSVCRIGDALQINYNVEYLLSSTRTMKAMPVHQKLFWPVSIFNNKSAAKKLEQYQKIGKFDVWQIHNLFPALSPVVYKKAFEWGIPIVHYLHSYRLGCTNGFLLNQETPCEKCIRGNFLPGLIHRSWRNSYVASGAMGAILTYTRQLQVFEKAHHWVALSHFHKQKHVEMGIPAEKIAVIHHFLEPISPPPPPAQNGYALFVGRLSQEKGVASLLEAWKILNRPDRQLVIVGEGTELPILKKKVKLLNLENVRFVGFKKAAEQTELWAGAAFSVLPSIWPEPLGMVVLESWAKARPVVAHRIGGIPELVAEGETGFMADPQRPEDLAAALARAFDSPEETKAMGRAGLARLQKEFNRQVWLEKIHLIYKTIPKLSSR